MDRKYEKIIERSHEEAKLLKKAGTVYDSKKYALTNGFFLTGDAVLMSIKNNELSVMLIKRKEMPFAGCWALPGGYAQADTDENILACSKRELEEETGVKDLYLEELCSFTQKYRDPRELIANSTIRIITIAHIALIDYKKVNAIAGDDAEEVEWFSVNKLPKNLAFDHKLVIEKAIDRVRGKLNYSNIGFEFVDKKSFTIPELQTIFEKILDKRLDRNNFRTKILKLGVLELLDDKKQEGPGKPAPYYKVNLENLYNLKGKTLF